MARQGSQPATLPFLSSSEEISYQPQPGPQSLFLTTTADIAVYGGAAGGGKAAPISSVVMTPFGQKTMGEIKVGSQVSNPDGTVARVLQIHPQGEQDVYEVEFSDGSTYDCTLDHLWLSWVSGKKYKADRKYLHTGESVTGRLYTTTQLLDIVRDANDSDYGRTALIPISEPTSFTVSLKGGARKIHPYILGVLLGDGCLSKEGGITFTSEDEEIVARVGNLLGIELIPYRKEGNKASAYRIPVRFGLADYLSRLGLLGKKSWEKFIPREYMLGTIEDRWELLCGLMDTDGTVSKDGKSYYCTTSETLANNVTWIVESLGGVATITTKNTSYTLDGEKYYGRQAYNLYIKFRDPSLAFHLTRKKERTRPPQSLYRRIVSIKFSRREECQCITVDSPNGLYLGDHFIVTHNSYGLLLEPLRHKDNGQFGGVIFRRTSPQVTTEGGLWDTASTIYPQLGAIPNMGNMSFRFPSGCVIAFRHLQHEKTKHDLQGAQIPFIGFDELTHFTRTQFFYMMSRNRSVSGVKPYIRATCNPDASSWVKWFIAPWVDRQFQEKYGWKAESGQVLWFRVVDDMMMWVKPGTPHAKSLTFISSSIYDNKILLEANPEYLDNLMALPMVERERLLAGNWDITESGNMFKREWFEIVYSRPREWKRIGRWWDIASSDPKKGQKKPDYTASVLMGESMTGVFYILDVTAMQATPKVVEDQIYQTAVADRKEFGSRYFVRMEQEPGSSGVQVVDRFHREVLRGFNFKGIRSTGSKIERAKPLSSEAQHGNIKLLYAPWNDTFFAFAEPFPTPGVKDDVIDAGSGIMSELLTMGERPLYMPMTSGATGWKPYQSLVPVGIQGRAGKSSLIYPV